MADLEQNAPQALGGDVNERADAMTELLTKQMTRREGITEHMKAEQPIVWIGRMNSIRSRVEEIVREKVIDTL